MRTLARLREALQDCERRLVEARISVVNAPDRGEGYMAVARLEKGRRDLLALTAAEEGTTARPEAPDPGLHRIADAARAALRLGLPRREQVEACYFLAFAERERGRHLAEAEALEQAVRLEPDTARLWLHLSVAYGRARQFRRAEAAQLRALALARRRE